MNAAFTARTIFTSKSLIFLTRLLHNRIFYGWVIVMASFITLAVAFGVWYSFSVFYIAILQDFGWQRAETAGIFSLFTIAHYLCAFIAGWLIDRFGPRLVIPVGALWLALSLSLVSRADCLRDFYIGYGILSAAGVSLIGFVPHAAFLPRWFSRRRGLALGLAMAGVGVGMLTIPPLMQSVIAASGWRRAYQLLGIIVLFTIPINLFFQRRDPQSIGLDADGISSSDDSSQPLKKRPPAPKIINRQWAETVWTISRALRTGRFWFLAGGFFMGPFAIQGVLLHAVAGLVDGGLSAAAAARVFGFLGICGSVGKITLGFFGDRWNRETANTIGMTSATLGVIAIFSLHYHPALLPWLFAICFGFGYGAAAPLFPSIAADIFQGPSFGRIFGLLSLNLGFGGAAGAWFSGYIYDLTGTYGWAFVFDIAALWLSCLCFWLAAPRHIRLSRGRS